MIAVEIVATALEAQFAYAVVPFVASQRAAASSTGVPQSVRLHQRNPRLFLGDPLRIYLVENVRKAKSTADYNEWKLD